MLQYAGLRAVQENAPNLLPINADTYGGFDDLRARLEACTHEILRAWETVFQMINFEFVIKTDLRHVVFLLGNGCIDFDISNHGFCVNHLEAIRAELIGWQGLRRPELNSLVVAELAQNNFLLSSIHRLL